MSQPPPAETPRPQILVPPRPNRGPEPWDDQATRPIWPPLALALAAVLAWMTWRLRRRRGTTPVLPPLPVDAPLDARLLALCDRLRTDLAARLGPALRARTTEELAADPRVAEILGEDLPRLAEILAAGDRLKFACVPVVDLAERLPEWSGWAETTSRARR